MKRLDKRYWKVPEVCEVMQISKSTLYKLTHYHLIPYFKPNGKTLYFRPEDVYEYMENHRKY